MSNRIQAFAHRMPFIEKSWIWENRCLTCFFSIWSRTKTAKRVYRFLQCELRLLDHRVKKLIEDLGLFEALGLLE